MKRQGAMLEAARGPLPTLTHAIAGDTAPLLWTVQDVYRAAECQSFIDLIEGSYDCNQILGLACIAND